MTNTALRWAGFLAMASAVLSIPFLILSFYLGDREDLVANVLHAAMYLVGTALFIFLASFLKRLLNARHSFHNVDNYIDFLIIINLIMGLAGIAGLFLPTWQEPLNQYAILLIVAFGVANILFGFKLFGLSDPLKGMLKPYCFFTIATGALLASVLLIPLGIITGAIADVMLGTIFFQAVERTESKSGEQPPPMP